MFFSKYLIHLFAQIQFIYSVTYFYLPEHVVVEVGGCRIVGMLVKNKNYSRLLWISL